MTSAQQKYVSSVLAVYVQDLSRPQSEKIRNENEKQENCLKKTCKKHKSKGLISFSFSWNHSLQHSRAWRGERQSSVLLPKLK